MRYMLLTVLLLHFNSYGILAQTDKPIKKPMLPRAEIGIVSGICFSYDVPASILGNVRLTSPSLHLAFDMCFDKHKSPLSFVMGFRAGRGTAGGLGVTAGIKYETHGSATFRTSLTAGPWIEGVDTRDQPGIQPDIIAEASAGSLLWNRLYLGVKYFHPFATYIYAVYNGSETPYRRHALLLDIKVDLRRPEKSDNLY